MLHSIQQRYGEKLRASDGEIGHVRDFYFDDKTWNVRYLVADTGHWLAGRLVLISPHAFGHVYPEGKILLVNLTRQQIEDSPSIDEHKPVSRQPEKSAARRDSAAWTACFHPRIRRFAPRARRNCEPFCDRVIKYGHLKDVLSAVRVDEFAPRPVLRSSRQRHEDGPFNNFVIKLNDPALRICL